LPGRLCLRTTNGQFEKLLADYTMPPLNVSIQHAEPSDFSELAHLHFSSHVTSFKPFASEQWVNSRQIDEYLAKWQQTLRTIDPADTTFIALFDSKIVGMVRVSPLMSPPYDAQLSSMHVLAELTGQGIGTLLMQSALEFIAQNKFERVQLGVITANSTARRFYEQHGWVLVDQRPDGVEGVPIAVYELNEPNLQQY